MQEDFFTEALTTLSERFPGLDSSTIGLVASLFDSYHILVAIIERAYAEYGVTPQSTDVLTTLYIRRETGCTLGEIGEILYVSPANVTGLVDGLVRKGLVTRTEHPVDRRKRVAKLTEKGEALVESFIPEGVSFLQEVFAEMGADERAGLQDKLVKMSRLLLPYWERRAWPKTEMGKKLAKTKK